MSTLMPARPWPTDDTDNKLTPMAISQDVGQLASEASYMSAPSGPLPPSEQVTAVYLHCRPLHPLGVRKPLRSSPLAGPALQADGSIPPEAAEVGKPRPSRISSTPDMPHLVPLQPPKHVRRPKTAESFQRLPPRTVSLASERRFSSHPFFTPQRLEKSGSVEMGRPKSMFLQPSLSTSTATPVPPLPSAPVKVYKDRNAPPSPTQKIRRPKSAHGYPSIPQTILASNTSSTEETSPPHIPVGEPQDNSWFIANPYEVTPKFSRLGLGSSNVVLPVSAKQHKRLSNQNLKSSIKLKTSIKRMKRTDSTASSPDSSTSISQQGTPSSTSYSASEGASSASSQPRENSTSPVISISPIPIVTAIDEGDEPLRHDLVNQTDNQQGSDGDSGALDSKNKRRLSRFSMLSFHSLKPSNSSTTKTRPISFGGKLRVDGNHHPFQGEFKLGKLASDSSSSNSESAVESKTPKLSKLPSSPSNKVFDIGKTFWKSITGWQRHRSRQRS